MVLKNNFSFFFFLFENLHCQRMLESDVRKLIGLNDYFR